MTDKNNKKSKATEVAHTLEWILTAFILAFVFRAFIMEAFRIPTGSMASTLRGDHYRLRCHQCGYEFDYGIDYQSRRPTSKTVRCPSCGYYQTISPSMPRSNGDRILVLKSIYQFFEPKRWDVIVFKNPHEPHINYIKRLIGKPGEKVEIIDGDVYINDKIQRKPEKVQNELWMPVFNNDYQPARPTKGYFNGSYWQQPFKNIGDSQWKVKKSNPTRFLLDETAEGFNSLVYDTSIGNDFRATYAYNDISRYSRMPYCSDIKLSMDLDTRDKDIITGVELSKYGIRYRGWLNGEGKINIERVISDNRIEELASGKIEDSSILSGVIPFSFANIDHLLKLKVGKEELVYDLGRDPNSAGPRKTSIEPKLKIFGSGSQVLSHIAIYRDIHYTSHTGGEVRGVEGRPMFLADDQFFAAGDNSPSSSDSRMWNKKGIGNNGKTFEIGVVPREYMIGKALWVYWPGGFKPFPQFPFSIIPDFGEIKLIYGGK